MGKPEDTNAALQQLVEALQSPAGPIPMDRALRAKPNVLPVLRQAGMTWQQIAYLAAKAGIRGKRGEVIQPAHWRSLSSRLGQQGPGNVVGSPSQPRPMTYEIRVDRSDRPCPPLPARAATATGVAKGKDAIKAEIKRLARVRRAEQ